MDLLLYLYFLNIYSFFYFLLLFLSLFLKELTGLWDASNKLYESMQHEDFQTGERFETALKDLLCLLMKLFDANDDGVLDPSDIESVLDKLFELFKSLSFLLTSCAKQVFYLFYFIFLS